MSATASWRDVIEGRALWSVDCADNAEILPAIPGGVIQHVITDPPYEAEAHTLQRRVMRGAGGVGRRGWDGDPRVQSVEALSFPPMTEPERAEAAVQFARLASRWIGVFCQIEAVYRWQDSLKAAGAVYKRTAIWVKPDGQPQLSGDRPGMGYETLVLAHAKGRSRWNGGGRTGVFTHNKNSSGAERAGHETQKPLPLMLELIDLFTDPGDLILDPYVGSGTTGVAALLRGRRFVGLERDPKYAETARTRCEAAAAGLTLRDARAGQRSLFDLAPPEPKPKSQRECVNCGSPLVVCNGIQCRSEASEPWPERNALEEIVE